MWDFLYMNMSGSWHHLRLHEEYKNVQLNPFSITAMHSIWIITERSFGVLKKYFSILSSLMQNYLIAS